MKNPYNCATVSTSSQLYSVYKSPKWCSKIFFQLTIKSCKALSVLSFICCSEQCCISAFVLQKLWLTTTIPKLPDSLYSQLFKATLLFLSYSNMLVITHTRQTLFHACLTFVYQLTFSSTFLYAAMIFCFNIHSKPGCHVKPKHTEQLLSGWC